MEDASHFALDFTKQSPVDSPVEGFLSKSENMLFQVSSTKNT